MDLKLQEDGNGGVSIDWGSHVGVLTRWILSFGVYIDEGPGFFGHSHGDRRKEPINSARA